MIDLAIPILIVGLTLALAWPLGWFEYWLPSPPPTFLDSRKSASKEFRWLWQFSLAASPLLVPE